MTLQTFLNLVRHGETATVDFKLVCNAFNRNAGDQDKARAELVKDICAMANNGLSTSYLIIGLGDDRVSVQTVNDPHLSSQNIQSLVRDAIHPRPLVRVHSVEWPDAPKPFSGVRFIVVQVGPNARHAFRLARDMISWSQKFHFRKHEVWIRNQDTSDLATPEQIGRLLGRNRSNDDIPDPSFINTEYQKLPTNEQRPALVRDVQQCLEEMGATLAQLPPEDRGLPENQFQFRARIPLGGKTFVFRCAFVRSLTTQSDRYIHLTGSWLCEHGVLIFVLGNSSAAGKFHGLVVNADTAWGHFGLLIARKHAFFRSNVPEKFGEPPISIVTLSKLKDTKRTRAALTRALKELQVDSALFGHLERSRVEINRELARWARRSAASVVKEFPIHHSPDTARAFRRNVLTTRQLLKRQSAGGLEKAVHVA